MQQPVAAAPSRALTPYQQVEQRLSAPGQLEAFKKMLPDHITVERFQRTILVAIQRTPSLVDCDRESLYLAVNAAAQDGLLPDGNEAAIVPMKGKAVYWRMVAGCMKKARNSGEIKTIMSQCVYEKDEFSYFVDEHGEHISHRPNLMEDRGKFRGVYAMATTKDGGVYVEVMGKAHIDKIKSMVRSSGPDTPWAQWPDRQAQKTSIKALCKRLPSSTDILGMPTPDMEDEGGDLMPVESFVPKSGQPEPEAAPAAAAPKPRGAGSRTQEATQEAQAAAAPAAAAPEVAKAQVIDEQPRPAQAVNGDLPI